MRFRKLVAGAVVASTLAMSSLAYADAPAMGSPVTASADIQGDQFDGHGGALTFVLLLDAAILGLTIYEVSRSP